MNWLNSPYVLALFPVALSALLLLAKGQILRLPSRLQPFVPILLAGIPVVLDQYQTIGVGPALLAGLLAGLEAIGVYHAAGKLRGKASPKEPQVAARPADDLSPTTKRSVGLCVFLALLTQPGCGILRSASDEVASICEGYLAAQPDVQVEAQRKGVSPLVIAEAICMANDAGRAIWELFEVQQPEPGVMQAVRPEEQLERARDQALSVARRKGLLPMTPGGLTYVDQDRHTLTASATFSLPARIVQ
jgi:hypothetical protein